LDRFRETEQVRLQPLPETSYDLAIWKVVKLHRDCHVVFDNAYYSAPFRLVGQQLRVRGGSREVRLYTQDYQLVTTHDRASQPGQRLTNPAHLPPEKLAGLLLGREACQSAAADIGSATARTVQGLLDDPVLDRLPTVKRLLRLRERFGDQRLEAACALAQRFDDPSYKTIRGILEKGKDQQAPAPVSTSSAASIFVRSAAELVGHLFGGVAWN
jgi:hypothetical protein